MSTSSNTTRAGRGKALRRQATTGRFGGSGRVAIKNTVRTAGEKHRRDLVKALVKMVGAEARETVDAKAADKEINRAIAEAIAGIQEALASAAETGKRTKRQRRPTHPGIVFADAIADIPDMSIAKAAAAMGVTRQYLNRIATGKGPVTPAMALRLGKFMGNGPGIWLRMQQAVDLWDAEQKLGRELKSIKRAEAA